MFSNHDTALEPEEPNMMICADAFLYTLQVTNSAACVFLWRGTLLVPYST